MQDHNPPPTFPPPDPAPDPATIPRAPVPPPLAAFGSPLAVDEGASAAPEDAARLSRVRRALGTWLGMLVAFGVGGILFGEQELALLVALSGVVIAAQAADLDPRWRRLYQLVSVALIGACAWVFLSLALYFGAADARSPLRLALQAYCVLAGLLVASTGARPVAQAIARRLFRVGDTTHAVRLATRLLLVGYLIALPAWFFLQDLLSSPEDITRAFGQLAHTGTLAGYVLVALAGVGFLVRRDTPATLERLGLDRIPSRHLLWIVVGVPLLFGVNAAGEWLQQRWFPALWSADRHVNEAIAQALDRRAIFVVGISAGIGEEIVMRGALQPRLGLVPTSLLFAALHVQYSWFGMATIFVFGMLLGTIRQRTNTTVVMAVHAIYDVLALLTT